jgi:hypothetical protein
MASETNRISDPVAALLALSGLGLFLYSVRQASRM